MVVTWKRRPLTRWHHPAHELEANGFRVETKGNVRVNYPYLGMGIAFVDMSAENQGQLAGLLSTI
jgi:hypothetical protein